MALTDTQKAEHIKAAAERAQKRAAGETVGKVTAIEAEFDKAHAARELLNAKAVKNELALDIKAAKKAGKIGFWERSKVLGFRETVGKPALIGAGIIAGVAALGMVVASMRKSRKEATKAEIDTASMLPPPVAMDPMVGQNTLMGMQPTPGARAEAVLAGRGTGGPGIGAS